MSRGGAAAKEPSHPPAPASEFRRLMGRWPTGVSVVTATEGGIDFGLTVNAFLSVSLVPPQVLISLSLDADTTPVVERTGRFAVNLLAFDQRPLSERFALAAAPVLKFRELPIRRTGSMLPLLPSTVGSLECVVRTSLRSADHVLLVGEVVALEPGRDVPPLVFYHGGYAESDGSGALRLPPSKG